jgi:hypothetical protein
MVTIIQLSQVATCAHWATPDLLPGAVGTLTKVAAAAMAQNKVGRA